MINAILLLAASALNAAAPVPGVRAMEHHRRVLIVAAPAAADPRLLTQRQILSGWRTGATDRDLSVVEVVGDRVEGAGDRASTLRRTWRLPVHDFLVLLVGKDGHEVLRTSRAISAATLATTIDAMPMRRAGQR